MSDEPTAGGCLEAIFAIATMLIGVYLFLFFALPWMQFDDRAMSSCPTSGVSVLARHYTWGGIDWSVTCLNGDRWHVSNGGNRKPFANPHRSE